MRSYALSAVAVTSVIALIVVIGSSPGDAGDAGGGSPAAPAPAPIFGGSRPPSGRPPPPALWSRRPPPPPPPRDTPTYDLTIGYCRGGPAWEEPHAWAGELWDCSPTGGMDGPNKDGMSVSECRAACDADPECGAFDIESHTASGETASECCLFRAGHTGEGSSERHCWVRGGAAAASAGNSGGAGGAAAAASANGIDVVQGYAHMRYLDQDWYLVRRDAGSSDPDGDTCWHPAEDNLLGTGKIVMLSRSIHLLRWLSR